MVDHAQPLAANANLSFWDARRERRRRRDMERGYRVRRTQILAAYAIELVVIAASLYGALLFARQYGHGDADVMGMMMLAPIGYAVIEFCRVPLAYAARTQPSWTIKLLAIAGVIGAAGVTVKSMSQLGEIMFRPRLHDVAASRQALKEALGAQEAANRAIAAADADLQRAKSGFDDAQSRVTRASADLSGLPPTRCFPASTVDRDGRRRTTQRCVSDARIAPLRANLVDSESHLKEARERLDEASRARAALDPRGSDARAVEAKAGFDRAVFNSQLHSFTGMAFGKDPQEASDGEIAAFLRIFVFAPAIFVSLASTMLAITAVERVGRPEDQLLALPDEAAQYILGPYAQAIVEEATDAAQRAEPRLRNAPGTPDAGRGGGLVPAEAAANAEARAIVTPLRRS